MINKWHCPHTHYEGSFCTDLLPKDTAVTPKIYVYDLPVYWTNCTNEFGQITHTPDVWRWHLYGAELTIPEALNDSQYTTSDPEEADLFYVHVHFYCKGGSIDIPALSETQSFPSTRHLPVIMPYFSNANSELVSRVVDMILQRSHQQGTMNNMHSALHQGCSTA